MKQIIPFLKDVSLNTRINEITSIALEHNLKMENGDSVVGEFIVSGKYKINDISVNEEVFEKKIPFDITLDDKYDASIVQIDIDDFYYEIINEEMLRLHIDVLVDNLVYVKKEEPEIIEIDEPELVIPKEVLKNNEDNSRANSLNIIDVEDESANEEVKERNVKMPSNEDEEKKIEVSKNLSSFITETEKYSTYKVHIIRDNETIDIIKEKYNVTKEELEKYNSLDNITIGTKIIIPILNE